MFDDNSILLRILEKDSNSLVLSNDEIVFTTVLKLSLRLNTIESKPLLTLSKSDFNKLIFLMISFYCEFKLLYS